MMKINNLKKQIQPQINLRAKEEDLKRKINNFKKDNPVCQT